MINSIRLWLWERRLAHAKLTRDGLEAEHERESLAAESDVEHCQQMVRHVRMEMVTQRANRALARVVNDRVQE